MPSSLIPAPRSFEPSTGVFALGRPVAVDASDDAAASASRLARVLGSEQAGASAVVEARIEPSVDFENPEAYRTEVTADRVKLAAASDAGLAQGVNCLVQLARLHPGGLPCCVIEDSPALPWRGLSLDVSRSFFGVEVVRRVIDRLADLRMNRLHLHLTDDHGWRLEIPGWPKLTEVSGPTAREGGVGGFYTAEEYQGLAAYAAERGVTLVPEIDLPGHANSVLHAYPELTIDGKGVPIYDGPESAFTRLEPTVAGTREFLTDVFSYLCSITPGEWIHLGGDEAVGMPLEDYAPLVDHMASVIQACGKTVVGWQEAANAPSMGEGTLIEFWAASDIAEPQGNAPFIAAVQRGARALIAPAVKSYLDMEYRKGVPAGAQTWAATITTREAYEWTPETVVPEIPIEAIEGVEAAIWCEFVFTEERLWLMLMPRLASVAEVAWREAGARGYVEGDSVGAVTSRDQAWADFEARLAAHGWREPTE